INADDFRIVFTSPKFPTSSFGYAHNLHPDLVKKIVDAFYAYRFTPAMQETFGGADRFYPVTYEKDWKVIRDIAASTGTSYNQDGLRKMAEKEAAKAAKKQ
ncbi:MAG: PhnD/SsuA/transferrin family substrate-binding protein, partial [Desulfotignum sp.]|nr:PhnD/SsuA/transferrin family substrate-binding protein [Desulfotignum sp.]